MRINRNKYTFLWRKNTPASRNGQAMVEYVMMMVLLLSTVVIMSIFLYTYKQHSERVVSLVASEYP